MTMQENTIKKNRKSKKAQEEPRTPKKFLKLQAMSQGLLKKHWRTSQGGVVHELTTANERARD